MSKIDQNTGYNKPTADVWSPLSLVSIFVQLPNFGLTNIMACCYYRSVYHIEAYVLQYALMLKLARKKCLDL